jgi:ribosome-binding factor A
VSRRTNRLAEEIREEVAKIIARELKDPRIGFVTVTGVQLTPDLRHARINVGVLGDQAARDKSLEGLRQAAGFVRRALGQRLRIRYTPEVAFQYDKGLDATERVARLLNDVAAPDAPAALDAPADDDTGEDD